MGESENALTFAAREILPAQILEAAIDADCIKAASPYVTCNRLFANTKASSKILYTDFRAISFISGASSLTVLRKLMELSVDIFHVSALHAKVFLIDENSFSLGSQNLTVQGQKNIEANVISGTETTTSSIVSFFEELHSKAIGLCVEDLDLMEQLIETIIPDFEAIAKKAEETDQEIADAIALRQEEEAGRRRETMKATLAELLASLKSKTTEHSRSIRATVKRLANVRDAGWNVTHTNS
ncbi:MAG: hypothetical protein ACI8T1_002021 [Verrucomicrobiales bacterium]|jgi:hypothetical protein